MLLLFACLPFHPFSITMHSLNVRNMCKPEHIYIMFAWINTAFIRRLGWVTAQRSFSFTMLSRKKGIKLNNFVQMAPSSFWEVSTQTLILNISRSLPSLLLLMSNSRAFRVLIEMAVWFLGQQKKKKITPNCSIAHLKSGFQG